MELRIRLEPVLSGLSLAFLLGLEEEDMGREFQARNFGDHRQGIMRSGHLNRAEHMAQTICPESHGPFARFSSWLVSGELCGGGASWGCVCFTAQLTNVLLSGELNSVCPGFTVVWWSGGEALEL